MDGNTCFVCGHEGADVHEALPGAGRTSAMLCRFCSATEAGNTVIYPTIHTSEMKFTAMMVAQLYWQLQETTEPKELPERNPQIG